LIVDRRQSFVALHKRIGGRSTGERLQPNALRRIGNLTRVSGLKEFGTVPNALA
jgi:hypothetical protein